jgi:hypothetical protein
LKEDEYKDIIIESLKFLVDDKRVEVNAFIIMSNPAYRQAGMCISFGNLYNIIRLHKYKLLF